MGRKGRVSLSTSMEIIEEVERRRDLVEFLYVDAGNPNPFRRARPASFKQGRVDLNKV